MNSVSKWILTGATVLLMQGVSAREHWGPPQPCPPPKVDCCKPKCPKPCAPKCNPQPCKPACPPKAECAPKAECCPKKPECPQPSPPTQLCPDPCPDPCCPTWPTPVLNAAYNYPAAITTRCPWDVYFDASFIYWQPIEENLELGYRYHETAPFTTPFAVGSPIHASAIRMDFDYKPGFKVGAGMKFDYDNWDVHGEYTWFYNKQHTTEGAGTGGVIFGTQGFPASGLFALPAGVGSGVADNVFNSAHAEWHLKMNIADLDLGRSYYVGTKLIFRPNVGLRGTFITQNYDVTYTNSPGFGIGFADVETITKKTSSWAVGPKVGLDTNWMFGWGFRLFGNGEADILYTRYTKLRFNETHTAVTGAGVTVMPVYVSDPAFGSVRAHMDLELGLGWGTYFNCNKWYLDMAAGYGFQIFWDQNMFHKFTDDVSWMNGFEPNGNLYIQGLTFTVKVDF